MPSVIHPTFTSPSATVPITSAVAKRQRDGHFYLMTSMSGTTVPMMLDTGASTVALRAEDAEKIGLHPDSLTYSARISTANGTSFAAPVTIPSLTVGGITRKDVQAIVSKPGTLNISLLGQSFLATLSGFKVTGDEIVMQGQ